MYINSNYGGAVTSDIVVMDKLIANIEPLLFKYKVNLGFWGHNHAYQRMTAVYNSKVIQESATVGDTALYSDPQATVHFVIGTAGAGFTKNAVTPYPSWCELVFYEYGYAKVTAVNATYLEWKFINSISNEIQDIAVITQLDPSAPFIISSDGSSDSGDDELTGGIIAAVVICSLIGVLLIGFISFKVVMGQPLMRCDLYSGGSTHSGDHEISSPMAPKNV
jgi:hypothetical protein